ncbi:Rha family transcriptional regulator [Escherichia coli]|uniref:Rha family transcriptional regulator n=1 Tax=Escherichia coli TaxID=562 RepID=UPI00098BFE70|nr:Rha family transcriptional regulator [Escherichia coli]
MSDLMVFNSIKMSSIEIAELVESRHANIKRSIERLVEKGIIRPAPLEHTNIINDLGIVTGVRDFYVFEGEQGKRDSIIVVAQNCPEFTARLVDRWQELENAVRQNAVPNYGNTQIENVLAFAETAGRMLNMSNSGKLGMLQKIEKEYNIPPILPHYAIDAPADAVDGSSRVTKSLTALLEENNVGMTAREVYLILERKGIVDRKYRKAKRGEKGFWNVTVYGLRYGKNITNPSNQRETQPHFYESRFKELLNIIFSE